eukprot:1367648-Prymnesium_polylepis.1
MSAMSVRQRERLSQQLVNASSPVTKKVRSVTVPCLPLSSLMAEANITYAHFLSLDVVRHTALCVRACEHAGYCESWRTWCGVACDKGALCAGISVCRRKVQRARSWRRCRTAAWAMHWWKSRATLRPLVP